MCGERRCGTGTRPGECWSWLARPLTLALTRLSRLSCFSRLTSVDLDAGDHAIHIAAEIGIGAHPQRIAIGERGEGRGQRLRRGHGGAGDEQRDNGNIAAHRQLKLNAHEVLWTIDAALPWDTRCPGPVWADHRQQHIAAGDQAIDLHAEVRARLERVDVLDHLACAKARFEVIVDAAAHILAVFAPV